MFACSLYPRSHAFLDTVQKEVRDVVRRLASHPSIVLWSGNNENQGEGTSSVQRQLDYVLLYDTTVQEELRRNDRTRSYWPASPSNGVLIDDPELGVFIQRWGSESDLRYGDIHLYDYYSVGTVSLTNRFDDRISASTPRPRWLPSSATTRCPPSSPCAP